MATVITEQQLQPLGYEKLTGLTVAKRLNPPIGAVYALVDAEGATIRWRDDGTAPTATTGMRIPADQDRWLTTKLGAVQVIEEAATGILNVSYYKPL